MPGPLLYYVRHGETEWNAERRLQGQHDIPLNDRGRKDAQHCGVLLAKLLARDGRDTGALDYVASPLVRARATMEILRDTLGLPPRDYQVEGRLAELSMGNWEGLTYREVQRQFGDVLARRDRNKWAFQIPGGESYVQLTERVGDWYAGLKADAVVAAHGGTGRALMAYLGLAAPEAATHVSIDHGVVYVLADGVFERHA